MRDSNSDIIRLPIFPLPNVVFFPQTLLPLHIFEPRYRQMVGEALEADALIGMVLLKHGWEDRGAVGGDTFQVGGMGKIADFRELEDGRYDIVLAGQSRYRIIEFERHSPYRLARAQLLQDTGPEAAQAEKLSRELIHWIRRLRLSRKGCLGREALRQLDFQTLVNSICSSVNIDAYSRQSLLEVDDLKSRAENVLLILKTLSQQERLVSQFEYLRPEDPSVN